MKIIMLIFITTLNFSIVNAFNVKENVWYTLEFQVRNDSKIENKLFIDIKLQKDKDSFLFYFSQIKFPCIIKSLSKDSLNIVIKELPDDAEIKKNIGLIPFSSPVIFKRQGHKYIAEKYSYSTFNNCTLVLSEKNILDKKMERFRKIIEFDFLNKEIITEFDMSNGFINSTAKEKIYNTFGINLSTIMLEVLNKPTKSQISQNVLALMNAYFSSRLMFEISPIRFEDINNIIINTDTNSEFSGTFTYNILDYKIQFEFCMKNSVNNTILTFWIVKNNKKEILKEKRFIPITNKVQYEGKGFGKNKEW